MNRKLRFAPNLAKVGFSIFLGWEIVSLIRFNQISKAQHVDGTEIGFFGFTMDNSDSQWGYLQDNFGLLLGFQLIFLIGSQIVKYISATKNRYLNLQIYNIFFGIGFSLFLHSLGFFFQISLITGFYLFQKYLQKIKYFVPILWIVSLIILFCNEKFDGYRFQYISGHLKELDIIQHDYQFIRWNVIFNLILLRMISYSCDRKWSQDNRHESITLIGQKTYSELVKDSQPQEEYNFISYLSYIYYVPLFFAGPTITFNAYNSQLKTPQQSLTRSKVFNLQSKVIKYVLRVYFIDLLTFMIFLHVCYPNAIAKDFRNSSIWESFSMMDFHIMSFFNLVFLWYKFLTIWRITRAWALMDGIETPENMNRCIYNNYNFSGFWRSWHRSFNQWLIRYIYVPLGGTKYKVFNMWVVFTFVALWHDFKLDLILWAWMICLALVPETAVMSYFNKDYYYKKWWFKYVCGLAGAFQIEMMCLANLVGFGNGHTGMEVVMKSWMSLQGILFIIMFMICRNMPGVWFMLNLRENEEFDKKF